MRALALTALVLVTGSCGFPEYQFPEESSEPAPVPVTYCDPNPCLNEGECVEVDDGHACLCPAGFRGD